MREHEKSNVTSMSPFAKWSWTAHAVKIAKRPSGQQQHKQLRDSYFGNECSSIEGDVRKESANRGREEEYEAVRHLPAQR